MKQKLSSCIFLAGLILAANAQAKPEWASKFGVGCIACHTSSSGGSVRSAALSAYRAGGLVPGLRDFVQASGANTRPHINAVAPEWDAEAGQLLTIPLAVSDEQQNNFDIFSKPSVVGATFSDSSTNIGNLPTVDFQWTPSDAQADKIYNLSFYVKETDSVEKLKSLPLKVKIRVWPAGNRDRSSVERFLVSTTKWQDGKLLLKGKLVLNKVMTPAEKLAYFGRTDLTVDLTQGIDGTGTAIATAIPIQFDVHGNWRLTNVALSASPAFACNLTIMFEGARATRKIIGAPKDCNPQQ